MLDYENIIGVSAIIVVLMSIVNLYTSRGSEEGTQASAEERFQGQEEEEVGQTTLLFLFLFDWRWDRPLRLPQS